MRNSLSALALLLCVLPLDARLQQQACGSHVARSQEELQLHLRSREAARASKFALGRTAAPAPALRSDMGDIAVMDDSDGVVAKRNPFNLNRKTLRFAPTATGRYTYALADEDTYDPIAASAGTPVTLTDDDSKEVAVPFAFPFFGASYSSLFVNSDGNITFGASDAAVTDRSLGRFMAGAPRIAPLFRDLDPSKTRAKVTAIAAGDRFIITWADVPEYADFGTGVRQSFQARLYRDGRIDFAWTAVDTTDAVVGISPGRLTGVPAIVSFLAAPRGEHPSTIGERFAGEDEVDIFAAAQKFYMNHEDSYDYLVFYNTLGVGARSDAVAYEVTVRSARKGSGDFPVNAGVQAGSRRRLQALLNMGPLSQYPQDPFGKIPIRPIDSPVTTLAHEAGHLFLAFASVRDENDSELRPMLSEDMVHWNFFFNSDASLLEGNRILDNGAPASPRFQTVAVLEKYSLLDQYLMGLRAPEEVPDTFYIRNPTLRSFVRFPRVGAAFDGDRRNVSISDVIAAEGRRVPDHTVAQRRFRFAFVLITAAGRDAKAEHVQQVEGYRQAFESFFSQAASGRASADSRLGRALRVSTWPAAGVMAGASGTATVELERPAPSPVNLLLRSARGAVEVPASVIVPAGSTRVTFNIRGIREGVDELTVEAAGGLYETVHSMVQVQPVTGLHLALQSGDMQAARAGVPLGEPVHVLVTDSNELPYSGVPVTASVRGGGSLASRTVLTDENGIASFRWTPGTEPAQHFTASLSQGASVTATAVGRPAFAADAVLNAASFQPGLTPGGIGVVFGANLASSGTTEVLLNGDRAHVFFANTGQVNFYVPETVSGSTVDVVIRQSVGASNSVLAPLSTVQPGIFFDSVTGYGAVQVAGKASVTQIEPAAPGDPIAIYATGLGANPMGRTQVQIGGQAAEVLYSGPAPGFLGLYQVNARVPMGVARGRVPLTITVDRAGSNEVSIQVR